MTKLTDEVVREAGAPQPNSSGAIRRDVSATLAPGSIVLLGVFFGLATGLLEVVILTFRKFALHEMIGRSPHFVWMAPVFYLLLFTVLALPLAVFVRKWPKLVERVALFGFAFLAAASTLILLVYGRLHNIALLVLCIGLGIQAVRLGVRWSGLQRTVRIGSVVLGAVVLVLGIAVSGWRVTAEQIRKAALPSAIAGAPNVLIIILDTVRAANLSLYGYSKPTTPEIDRFAQRGVVFENAISPSPWTLPSHASLFTGVPAHQLSASWEMPLDNARTTLAESFRDRGYETAGFVANLIFGTWETGLNRGFLRYEDFQISPGQLVMNASLGRFISGRWSIRELIGNDEVLGRKTAARISDDFLDWVGTSRERPFFAFLNYYDAHDPYLPPDEYYRAMSGESRPHRLSPLRRVPVPQRRQGISAEAMQIEMDSYDGALAYLDHSVGNMLRELESRGLLENTVVVITSDHGEEFGEHGVWYHGNTLYLPALHVPLVIALGDRLPGGKRVSAPVSLTDLAATIDELSGAANSRQFPGVSLSQTWNEGAAARPVVSSVRKGVRLPEWYPISAHDLTSVVLDGSHYIRSSAGSEELYDFTSDRWEKHNLARQADAQARLDLMRRALPAATER